MLYRGYFRDFKDSIKSPVIWERKHLLRFFPYSPRFVYRLIQQCGFYPQAYRESWPDLVANLQSDLWSAPHFVHYMEHQTKVIRGFAIRLNFDVLDTLCRLPMLSRVRKASLVRSLIQAEMDFDKECVYRKEWWDRTIEALRAVGDPLLIIGDSHSLIYRQTTRALFGRVSVPLHVFCGGGSAVGLANPKSRSGYSTRLEKIFQALAKSSDHGLAMPVCFAFGQVDSEFVYTYKRIKEQQQDFVFSKGAMFLKTVAEAYLKWIATLGIHNVYVIGVNPPCVDDAFILDTYSIQMSTYHQSNLMDGESEAEVAALIGRMARLEFPTKKVRTALHALFNDRLREISRPLGFRYLDNFQDMVGPDGCIDAKYACALEGQEVKQGATGKDIHVAGDHSMRLKAMSIDAITRSARQPKKTPSVYDRKAADHFPELSQ